MMKQYLLSVHGTHGEPMPAPDEMQKMFDDVDKVNQEIRDAGAWVFACGLTDPSHATVVRVEGGKVMTTDGPFVETKEFLAGFYLIEAADLDDALAWASKACAALHIAIEVRPFVDASAG
jgi:hypothetical protein